MDTSSRAKSIIIFCIYLFIVFACNHTDPIGTSRKFDITAKRIIGVPEYNRIYNNLKDTIDTWVINKFMQVEAETIYKYCMDSLLCFDHSGSRFITCRHLYINVPDANSDDLKFFFGEKINGNWYICSGASIVIPRKMIKDHNLSQPLSYQELHEIALKEVYAGYLNEDGNINESWFKQHFENVGMCAECKTSEDFKKSFYESAMAQWANRDTTQPIKRISKTEKIP